MEKYGQLPGEGGEHGVRGDGQLVLLSHLLSGNQESSCCRCCWGGRPGDHDGDGQDYLMPTGSLLRMVGMDGGAPGGPGDLPQDGVEDNLHS